MQQWGGWPGQDQLDAPFERYRALLPPDPSWADRGHDSARSNPVPTELWRQTVMALPSSMGCLRESNRAFRVGSEELTSLPTPRGVAKRSHSCSRETTGKLVYPSVRPSSSTPLGSRPASNRAFLLGSDCRKSRRDSARSGRRKGSSRIAVTRREFGPAESASPVNEPENSSVRPAIRIRRGTGAARPPPEHVLQATPLRVIRAIRG